jgi:catechol 2,3-dioxygenase-like lactoylglutathione lyase family enzyme
MPLTGAAAVLLFVDDFAAQLRFYSDGLGALGLNHARKDEPGFSPSGPRYVLDRNWATFYLGASLEAPSFVIELLDRELLDPVFSLRSPRGNNVVPTLHITELEAAVDHLTAHGASLPGGIVNDDWGDNVVFRHARMFDPEGNLFELFEL